MSSSATLKVKLDQEVCTVAEKLVRLYTELADMLDLYSSKNGPQLVWNGNLFNGLLEIEEFWRTLPATSHEVTCLDAHRIDPSSDDKSLVVLAMGTVTIEFSSAE
uniref:Nuclear transport factor 2 n=1 Tax=Globodera rostochiensis TaxID=31243 RepID=A0A914I3W3_GLORO